MKFIALTLLCICPLITAEEPKKKPNIIFIYADDWGWGDLSCHGHPYVKTPNIDRLAAEGMDFQQFNVVNPVCSPSRAGVMTGQYPARHSIHGHFAEPSSNAKRNMPDWLNPKAPMLPRFLKEAGYRTAHFGKWHLTNRETQGAPEPSAYGYDEAKVFNGGAEWPSADLKAAGDDTATFIKAHADKPFFINVWLHESHLPHVPTDASMEQWKHLNEQKQVYAAVITDGDNAVGKILAALKETGLEKNTIVMFSSDNGPENTAKSGKGLTKKDNTTAEPGYGGYYSVGDTGGLRGRKRSLFEGGVRVPFIVRWPNITPSNVKNDTTVITAVDLLTTLCAAAEITLPESYKSDGENLLPALKGENVKRTRPIFWDWRGGSGATDFWPRLAVRDGDWKLVLHDEEKRAELYNIPADRTESKDVAKDHPDIVTRLSKIAREWQATLPTKPDPSCISDRNKPTPKASPKKSKPRKPLSM